MLTSSPSLPHPRRPHRAPAALAALLALALACGGGGGGGSTPPPQPDAPRGNAQRGETSAGTAAEVEVQVFAGQIVAPVQVLDDAWLGGRLDLEPPLPANLTLSPGTGLLSGHADATHQGTRKYLATVHKDNRFRQFPIQLSVLPAPALLYPSASLSLRLGETLAVQAPKGKAWADAEFQVQPDLPPGLELARRGGALSGKALALAPSRVYVITATLNGLKARTEVTLDVRPVPPRLVYARPVMNAEAGLRVEDNPLQGAPWAGATYTLRPDLPAGLELDRATGRIFGTPVAPAATAVYTLTGRLGADHATGEVTITVTRPATRAFAYAQPSMVCVRGVQVSNAPSPAPFSLATYEATPDLGRLGLVLDALTGRIHGVPRRAAPATDHAITAVLDGRMAKAKVRIEVQEPPKPAYPAFSLTLAAGKPMAPFALVTHPWAGCTYAIDPPLPAPLAFDAKTGTISGTAPAFASRRAHRITASLNGETTATFLDIVVTKPDPGPFTYGKARYDLVRGRKLDPPITVATAPWPGCTYTITPALGGGLTFSPLDGSISGTPLANQAPTTYQVSAIQGSDRVVTRFILAVGPAPARTFVHQPADLLLEEGTAVPPPGLMPQEPLGPGWTYKIQPDLPNDLRFDAATGRIYGKPTTGSPTTLYQVTARKGAEEATASFSLTVVYLFHYTHPEQALTQGQPMPINPLVEPLWYGARWEAAPAFPEGIRVHPTTGDLSGRPTAVSPRQTTTVTFRAGGRIGKAQVTLTVAATGRTTFDYQTPDMRLKVGEAAPVNAPTWRPEIAALYRIEPAVPAGLKFDTLTGRIDGTPTRLGARTVHTVTVAYGGQTAAAQVAITVADPTPGRLTYAKPVMEVVAGDPMENALVSAPMPGATYTVAPPLPVGLRPNADGTIEGVPTEEQAQTVHTVRATLGAEVREGTFMLTVVLPKPMFLRYDPAAHKFMKGVRIDPPVPPRWDSGRPKTWTSDPPLPAGLDLDPLTGALIGTPEADQAQASYRITARNSGGSSSTLVTIEIGLPQRPTRLRYALPGGRLRVGVPIELMPTVEGGAPTQYRVEPPLPAGLRLDRERGVIQGTPTAPAALTTYHVTASNAIGDAACDLTFAVVTEAVPAEILAPGVVHPEVEDLIARVEVGPEVACTWTLRRLFTHAALTSGHQGPEVRFRAGDSEGTFRLEVVMTTPDGREHRLEKTIEVERNAWMSRETAPAKIDLAAPVTATPVSRDPEHPSRKDRILVLGGRFHLPYPYEGSVTGALVAPSTGKWTALAEPLPLPLLEHTATELNDGRVLVLGRTEAGPVALLYAFGAWKQVPLPNTPRSGYTATEVSPKDKQTLVLIAGGRSLATGDLLADAERLDLGSLTWHAAAPMAHPRRGHTATLLVDRRVLVVGGLPDGTTAELYDPISDAWETTPPLHGKRIGHAALLLPDERVLVAGGEGAATEVFDPVLDTWALAGHLHHPRKGLTLTAIAANKVLAAGGEGPAPGVGIRACEIFTLGTHTWEASARLHSDRIGHAACSDTDLKVNVLFGKKAGLCLESFDFARDPFFRAPEPPRFATAADWRMLGLEPPPAGGPYPSLAVVTKAYRKASLTNHPDREHNRTRQAKANANFRRLGDAYDRVKRTCGY